MSIKEMLELVAEFQKVSDQVVNEEPTNEVSYFNKLLRYQLMKEENREYRLAIEENDVVEVFDACIDMMYILAGTINQHGMQHVFEYGFRRVHENNMSKVVDGKVLRNSEGKVIKPEGFVEVNLKDLVE
jgi:predicted HAD superfamily Cof-like phosphohydrolase